MIQKKMPKYSYKCAKCDDIFFFHHSISEIKTDCEKCGAIETLTRLPSKFSIKKELEPEKKVGQVVKQSIEEFQTELKEEKNRLKNHMWSADD